MKKRKVIKEGLLTALASVFLKAATKAELRNDPEFIEWFTLNHKKLKELNKEIEEIDKRMRSWKE